MLSGPRGPSDRSPESRWLGQGAFACLESGGFTTRRDARLTADQVVQQRDAAQLLMNLCRELVRLPVSFGALDPTSCNPGALVYMPNSPMTLVGFQKSLRQGIVTICNDVVHVEGQRAFLDQRREGCLERTTSCCPVKVEGRSDRGRNTT
jgi:hypothetical protein